MRIQVVRVVSTVVSQENVVKSSSTGADVFKLTYLEEMYPNLKDSNSKCKGEVEISNQQFLNQDYKRSGYGGLLMRVFFMDGNNIGFPWEGIGFTHTNADNRKSKAQAWEFVENVTYLEPGESSEIQAKMVLELASGYLVLTPKGPPTLYHEPHCVYNKDFLKKEKADIVITLVIKKLLPIFPFVYGQEDAVQLAKLLDAKFFVPMKNGDLDSREFLASIIRAEGTIESFK
ncbi:hypothetical protein RJ641_003262, partial [Dillenia turbinata]